MELATLVATSERVGATSKRTEKVRLLTELLRATRPADAAAVVGLLVGEPRQGRVGVGWATLAGVEALSPPAAEASLTVADVDAALDRLAALHGGGSQRERAGALAALLGAATEPERAYLVRAMTGEVRHGANAGLVTDAVAAAGGLPPAVVRRAAMLLGDLGETAARALRGDPLAHVGLTPLVGVQPMLAASAASVAEALEATGPASVEWKLDGARVQVHRRGSEVRVYTRSLREIAGSVPEIVAAVTALAVDEIVLDGEALGLDADGRPLKFQDTMSVGARLRPFFFDVLQVGGTSLIDSPLHRRKAVLRDTVPSMLLLPTLDTDDPGEADRFAAASLRAGHEGVMVKALESRYEAGRRGSTWRKVKPVHTVDLVVLAAEWGHGRRQGWLSNLHLGARGADGGFVMVGKTFKGMTDEMLRHQTEALQRLAIGSDGHVVHVRPQLVVEIALDGVQRSNRYPGGVALRFARVRRYRPDKRAEEADTIDRVRAML